jgi:hypothetical protein
METRLSFNFITNDTKFGGAIGLTHNFESPNRGAVPFIGILGTLSRRSSGFADSEQFGLGLTLGVKTIGGSPSPRFEVFATRRFSNLDFSADYIVAANIGFSLFFKSSNPWDK